MLKIYGNRKSGSANKVEYTAILLGTAYEYQEMDFQKDLKTEWYLKIHPAGKVPAIDDDGFILFESGAICKYLCDKKGNNMYPKDLKQRALVDQWSDFSVQHVGSAMGKVAFGRVFAPMLGLPVDEKSIQEGDKYLKQFLPIIDTQLGKMQFLASSTLSLADLSLLGVLEYAEAAQYDLSSYQNLTTWRTHLMSMEFYKRVHKK